MKIRKLGPDTLEACAAEASDVLKAGGVILFPTDTLYGLGADALSDEAVQKIYDIKGRDEKKPIHGIASDVNMLEVYGVLSDIGRTIAQRFFPGPLTLILEKRPEFDSGITKGIATIGFRIPNNEFDREVARVFGRPYTATSANIAGQKPQRSLGAILAQLGPAIAMIDIAFDAGELPQSEPSTVIDVSSDEAVVLRNGAIPSSEILAALD